MVNFNAKYGISETSESPKRFEVVQRPLFRTSGITPKVVFTGDLDECRDYLTDVEIDFIGGNLGRYEFLKRTPFALKVFPEGEPGAKWKIRPVKFRKRNC